MKVRVKNENTITTFLNVRDEWLLTDANQLIVVREVQYTRSTPENPVEDPEPTPVNTKRYRRRKNRTTTEPKERMYITKLVVNGYHADGKFIGTYNDDWCKRIIESQDDPHFTFSLYKLRKNWTDILEQKDAMLEHEAEMNAKKQETEPKETQTETK
jgi:hypothetical protein